MRFVLLATGGLLVVVVVASFGAPAATAQGFPRAQATIRACTAAGVVGEVLGSAQLVETPSPEGVKNVTVMLSVAPGSTSKLAQGKHAVHIHETGACTPTCTAAGSHVDLGPFGNNIPVTANHPYHSGDLINIQVGATGSGLMTHVTNRIAVSSGNLSIFDADGAAIVIHALPDLYCTDTSDPNCAGGGRVACGVLTKVP